MRVTSIINGKGGIGKTSTARALLARLTDLGYKALAIDYDPSGNLTRSLNVDESANPTMYHVIAGEKGPDGKPLSINDIILETDQGLLIAGNATLDKLESMYRDGDFIDGIWQLSEHIKQLDPTITHLIIDNNPKIGGMVSMQSLAAATDLVAPIEADEFGLMGLETLELAMRRIAKYGKTDLVIDGILITRYEAQTTTAREFAEALQGWARKLNTKVYASRIRKGLSVKNSSLERVSVYQYKIDGGRENKPAKDYIDFVDEYLHAERV
ncbi:ParA family protein [Eubacteriales bacterium OttesenSCG-928-A19]|nr:ParA family protein [Eubacteriales bacterium OttesenSCG-928-A19]